MIRGIGGNRVWSSVDGMRVPDFPGSNAGAGNYTRDISTSRTSSRSRSCAAPPRRSTAPTRWAASSPTPPRIRRDYFVPGGKNYYASVKGAYSGANQMFAETFTGAYRAGNVEFLGIYTRRDGGSDARRPSPRSRTNPTTWCENNFMGKLVFRPTENDTIRLVGEYYQDTQNTEVLSNVGDFPSLFAKRLRRMGRRTTPQRSRISAQWVHDAPVGFVDRIDFLAYFNSVIRQEDTMTLRGTNNSVIPNNYAGYSSFWFTQNINGAELQLNTNAKIFDLSNYFTYGLSFSYTTTQPAA